MSDQYHIRGDHQGRSDQDEQEHLGFLILPPSNPAPSQEPGIQHETDPSERHEQDQPKFDPDVVIIGDAFVVGTKTAG